MKLLDKLKWHKYLDNDVFLRILYDNVPDLVDVNIWSIIAIDGGPTIKVGLDMPRFADHPPQKWEASSNTVRLSLVFFASSVFRWKGWVPSNMSHIEIEPMGKSRYGVQISSEAMLMSFITRGIHTEDIQAYYREDRK